MDPGDATSDSSSNSGSSASEALEETIYITEYVEEKPQIVKPTLNFQFDFTTLRCLKWLLVDQKNVELEMKDPPEVDNAEYASSDEDNWTKSQKKPTNPRARPVRINMSCEWQRCTAQFDDQTEYADHIKDHYDSVIQSRNPQDNSQFNCDWDLCGFKTKDQDMFERHVLDHERHGWFLAMGEQMELKYKLPKCHLGGMERNRLPEMIDEYKCLWKDCQTSFRSISHYINHLYGHVPPKPTEFMCHWNNCGKDVAKTCKTKCLRPRLIKHMENVHVMPRWACRKCGLEKKARMSFFAHFLSQVTEKDPEMCCKFCNKLFLKKAQLQSHLKDQHQGVVCEICHWTFGNKRYLDKHINAVHLDIYRFRCSVCNKGYASQKLVDLHMQTHRPDPDGYKCKHCDFVARTAYIRRDHIWNEHSRAKYPYECHLCDDRPQFPISYNLSQHLKKVHDMKEPPPGFRKFYYRLEGNLVYRLRLKKEFQNECEPTYPKTIVPKKFEPVEIKLRKLETQNNVIKFAIETTPIVIPEPPPEEPPQIVTRAKARRILEESLPKKVPAKRRRKAAKDVNQSPKMNIHTQLQEEPQNIQLIIPWEEP